MSLPLTSGTMDLRIRAEKCERRHPLLSIFHSKEGAALTLQQLLDSIMKKYPHSFPNADIISMINETQKQLFRTLYKPETATTYDIIADNPFYPIDYSPQNIIEVVVNGCEYKQQNIRYGGLSHYYYITEDNTIGLFPTPEKDATNGLTVFRYKEPKELTTSDLANEPEFDQAWHMLIVYRVCKDLAEIALDANMANVFIGQYNGLETEYKRSKRAKPHRIADVYGGCRW